MSDVQTALTLYYAPRTRSFTALWLLEELGVDYQLESFAIRTGRHKKDDFLGMNPMGKVPVVVHDGVPISELGAIAIYLADRFPESGLAPAHDDPTRPAYLRWLFFASAIMEPAYAQKLFGWEAPSSSVAWGSYEHMLDAVVAGVDHDHWLLGEQFSAADVLIASNLRFGHMFGAVPDEGPTHDFVARCSRREACLRAAAIERREGERFPPPVTS